jgi:hypothetical protein
MEAQASEKRVAFLETELAKLNDQVSQSARSVASPRERLEPDSEEEMMTQQLREQVQNLQNQLNGKLAQETKALKALQQSDTTVKELKASLL